MRHFLFLTAVIFVLLIQVRGYANIAGSPHDFSGVYTHGEAEGEICKICHTPHNAGSKLVPLWNGRLSSSPTYVLYSSDTLDATVNQPLVPTKACLTCHDGTIAKEMVTGCGSCHKMHTANTDLNNDHPVSFTFDTTLAQKDGTLRDPNTTPVPSLGGKTIQAGMLYQNRMECTTCHDVHATKGDATITPKQLLVNNTQSKLCFTCHNK